MRQYTPTIVTCLICFAIPATYAVYHKSAPTIVQPQTVIVARGDASASALSRSEKRQLDAQWGELDQKEIDALSGLLKAIPKFPLTIFCVDDSRCGDMQLDFDNAFETAHWETRLEKPLIDNTIGIATSSPPLRDAINSATSNRLNVEIIAKNGSLDFLVIGNKGGKRQ